MSAYTPSYPGQNVASLVALSMERVKSGIIDAASEDYATYYLLTKNGRVSYEDGGTAISRPVMYGLNNSIQSYFAGEAYNLERPSGFTRCYYKWSYVGGTAVSDGPTEFENSGRTGLISLAKQYVVQLKTSFADEMNSMLLGDGTGHNGADLLGLDILIEDGTSWSTVGNIDSNANTWWRNYWDDASSTVWGTGANAYGIKRLKHAIKSVIKPGMGRPNVFLTCLDQYELLENAIASNITYNMPDLADAAYAEVGFGGVRIDKIPVVYDTNLDGHATCDNTWFLINTKALELVIGKNKAFDVSPPIPHPWMDATIIKAKLYGQLVVLDRRDCLGRIKLNAAAA